MAQEGLQDDLGEVKSVVPYLGARNGFTVDISSLEGRSATTG